MISDIFGQREVREEVTLYEQSEEECGAQYSGEWLKDTEIRQGRGKLVRKDGLSYSGYFLKDKFHLKGILIFASNDKFNRVQYSGSFKDGEFDGPGTMELTNGDSYWAIWYNGKERGQGKSEN